LCDLHGSCLSIILFILISFHSLPVAGILCHRRSVGIAGGAIYNKIAATQVPRTVSVPHDISGDAALELADKGSAFGAVATMPAELDGVEVRRRAGSEDKNSCFER
jgi:hypothetical protein